MIARAYLVAMRPGDDGDGGGRRAREVESRRYGAVVDIVLCGEMTSSGSTSPKAVSDNGCAAGYALYCGLYR